MGFHDSFYDGQPEPSATMRRRMLRFEHFFALFDWNSWPIVFDVDSPFIVISDTNGHVGPTVFDSIPEQIFENVPQPVGIALEGHFVDDLDGRVVRVYCRPALPDEVSQTDRLGFAYRVALASKRQRVLILPAVSQSRYPSSRGDGYLETVTADSINDRLHPVERLQEWIKMITFGCLENSPLRLEV